MTVAGRYEFRPATMRDLDLLRGWQAAPHVNLWWGNEEPFDATELADQRVCRLIVSLEDRPFAYIQDYAVHGWEQHHFGCLPKGSRGIDQYIGEADMIGLGHGPEFIRRRMTELFTAGAPIVATDPHPDNARAIAAYRKLGFRDLGPAEQTEWGIVVPMATSKTA